MIGFIYIMSNPAHPGLLKIGRTSKDPDIRRNDLNSTGVPEDFVLEYRALASDYFRLEKEIHRRLTNIRHRQDREFFKITVPEAINLIREIAGDRIENEKIFYTSPEELKKLEEEKRRKKKEKKERMAKLGLKRKRELKMRAYRRLFRDLTKVPLLRYIFLLVLLGFIFLLMEAVFG